MLRFRTVLAVALAPFILAAAQAPAGEPTAMPADKEGWKADKVVCKKFPPPTGTRMRERRICKTNAQWDAMQRDQKELLDEIQGIKPNIGS